jgi:hypothetical protein
MDFSFAAQELSKLIDCETPGHWRTKTSQVTYAGATEEYGLKMKPMLKYRILSMDIEFAGATGTR